MEIRGGLLDGKVLVRFVPVNAKTAQYVKADVLLTLGREAHFSNELANYSTGQVWPQTRAQIIGALVRARKRTRKAENGDVYLDVFINDRIRLSPAASPTSEGGGFPPPDQPVLPSEPSRDSMGGTPFPDDSHAPDDNEDEIPF